MKKVILGMMLVMVFLSFSKDRDNCVNRYVDESSFLFNDSENDRVDYFDDLKLRAEAGYNIEELKRKRKIMLSSIFDD